MEYSAKRQSKGYVRFILLFLVYAMSVFGILCISMATYDVDVSEGMPLLNKILNSRSSMWQSIFFLVSPVVLFFMFIFPMEWLRSGGVRLAYTGVLALLAATLAFGAVSNGLRGWLKSSILGRSLQPCEFAKLSVLLGLAAVLSKEENPLKTFKDYLIVFALVGIPALLVLLQGETGSVIVIMVVTFVMLFFAGANLRFLGVLGGIAIAAVIALVVYGTVSGTTDYRILRLLAFLDPQKYSSSGGYQIIMSQRAIGSGQTAGNGMFVPGSWTTLGYVPESSTDSIFSVVGECFGFLGCMLVLLGYLGMTVCMLIIAHSTRDKFGQLTVIGVMTMIVFHVFQNIAMSIGYMPITGIPLPFLSYGGSNFITNIASIGLVCNISRNAAATGMYSVKLPRIRKVNEVKPTVMDTLGSMRVPELPRGWYARFKAVKARKKMVRKRKKAQKKANKGNKHASITV